MKIYFGSEAGKHEYLNSDGEHPGEDFEHNPDNQAAMGPGDVTRQYRQASFITLPNRRDSPGVRRSR